MPLGILNYNTSYRTSLRCESTRVFYGRVPHNKLDQKLGFKLDRNPKVTTDFADELFRRTQFFLQQKQVERQAVNRQIQKLL